ncbi:MAG TPA: hypothetical protein PKL45_15315 [Bacteroidia bacterium]|nr:hypothetical protein [Bacteroidia bacterium]
MFYLALGLISLIFFIAVSRSGSDTNTYSKSSEPQMVGKNVCDLIFSYLHSIKMENLSPLIMTELFAFVYYEIDSLLYFRKISARERITNSLLETFDVVISKSFPSLSLDYAQSAFTERVNEYAAMTRANKDKSEIVDRFNLIFSHAKKGVHYRSGETPVMIGGFRESFDETNNTHSFYLSYLVPFMKNVVTNFS